MRLSFPILVAAAAVVASCTRDPSTLKSAAPLPAVRVGVATVQRETAPTSIEVPGTVRPLERAVVAAKISATIESLPLTLGQAVKRGDVLVRLTAPELTARLAQAQAQLAQAVREESRNRELAATGADTADAARAAVDRLAGARAAAAEAEAMLAYAEIRAPFDGRVAQKFAYAGDLASPGQPLLVLENFSALQIEAAIPASLAAYLPLGAKVMAFATGETAPFSCTVTEVAAAADSATHTVLVKLTLPASDLALSGRAARVTIAGPAAEALLVPADAVTRFGQMERVFVVSDDHAHLRLVKTGATRGNRVEVLSGVAAGETVVVAPAGTLRDGQPVIHGP